MKMKLSKNHNNIKCEHEYTRGRVLEPVGWYYCETRYKVEYICVKCGAKKYKEE